MAPFCRPNFRCRQSARNERALQYLVRSRSSIGGIPGKRVTAVRPIASKVPAPRVAAGIVRRLTVLPRNQSSIVGGALSLWCFWHHQRTVCSGYYRVKPTRRRSPTYLGSKRTASNFGSTFNQGMELERSAYARSSCANAFSRSPSAKYTSATG